MKTSNFAYWQHQRFPGGISISRYPDRRSGFDGPEFPPLMPSAQLLKWYKSKEGDEHDWYVYRTLYLKQLACLDAQKVFDCLSDLVGGIAEPVLLCYESAKTLDTAPCHRRLVAEWFETELGLVVPEWTK